MKRKLTQCSCSLNQAWSGSGDQGRTGATIIVSDSEIIFLSDLSNQPDPQAQAGFMSGEGQSYLLPLSGEEDH